MFRWCFARTFGTYYKWLIIRHKQGGVLALLGPRKKPSTFVGGFFRGPRLFIHWGEPQTPGLRPRRRSAVVAPGLLFIDIDRFPVLAAVGLLGAVQHSPAADLPAVKGKFQLPARTSLGKDVVLHCNPVQLSLLFHCVYKMRIIFQLLLYNHN